MGMSKAFRAWLGGLISAFCSGVSGGIAAMGFDPIDFNFQAGLYKLGGMSIVVGLIGVINYLSRSPIWQDEETTTTTVSRTVTTATKEGE